MKVIDLIQNMQVAIDDLSFHPADTEVSIKAGAFSTLTGNVTVDDSTGTVVMKFEQKVTPLDASLGNIIDNYSASSGGKTFDWSKVKITADQLKSASSPSGQHSFSIAKSRGAGAPIIYNEDGDCRDPDQGSEPIADDGGDTINGLLIDEITRPSPEVNRAMKTLLTDDNGKQILDLDIELDDWIDWPALLRQRIAGAAQKTWLAKHEDLHRRYLAEVERTREEPRNYTSRWGEDSEFARDMGWTKREDDS